MDFLDIFGISTICESLKEKVGDLFQKSSPSYLSELKPHKFNFRPQTLNEYIGQENAKEQVRIGIYKCLNIKPSHFLISGIKGCGKSTLAGIISNELQFPITYHIGKVFTKEALLDFLNKNQTSKMPCVLFVDEVHGLDKNIAEYMYPIIEDFKLPEGKSVNLRPFIFIGATTEKDTLIKHYAPFVDRCGSDIWLEPYMPKDIEQILRQYNKKIYQAQVGDEIFELLSLNTRLTPRIAINWFDDYIVTKDIRRVLQAHRVITDGLTDMDILILNHLTEINKPVGIEALSIIANTTKETFGLLIEPFIIQQGYMTRTSRGRLITDKGKKLVKGLYEKNNLSSM